MYEILSVQLVHVEQRFQRMQQQLKDLRAQGVGTTGAGTAGSFFLENKIKI